MKRGRFLGSIGLAFLSVGAFPMKVLEKISESRGNFFYIYSNNKLKRRFYKFLKNVFNLYPEDKLHNVIATASREHNSDQQIYSNAQQQLGGIDPFLSIFTYKLPSLLKQKDEMAKQTVELLGKGSSFDGYLEIGSSGRYLDYLEEKVKIKGKRWYADGKKPGYSVTEMIDRGQISIGAEYIPTDEYCTNYGNYIALESLDLVTVYIGFHHCPLDLRCDYISSIRDVMRTGGKLVLRDHDCNSEDQKTIVALAHDVFNMGTNESWDYNQQEIRNFYSLQFIQEFVSSLGFRFEKRSLFQKGDPTKNALMLFTKI